MTTTMERDSVGLYVLEAVKGHTMRAPRSQQHDEHRIGASEIGLCRSFIKHMTIGTDYDESDDPKWPAFIGTAVGDHVEAAYKDEHPEAITQAEFTATLPSGMEIPCHSDIIDPVLNILIDIKTKDGLSLVRAEGGKPSRQYRYQVAIYLLGAIQAGLLKEGARAFLVYMDRSGEEAIPVTEEVLVDEWLYQEIEDWIGDAMYGVVNDVEVQKDKEYEWCSRFCPFFSSCRGGDSLASGLIEDEDAQAALKLHLVAKQKEKEAKQEKEAAKKVLMPYAQKGGYIISDEGPFEISTTIIGASSYMVDRAESERMNVRPKKGK